MSKFFYSNQLTMKKLLVVLMALLIFSCNNGPAKEETQKADTTAAVAPSDICEALPAVIVPLT